MILLQWNQVFYKSYFASIAAMKLVMGMEGKDISSFKNKQKQQQKLVNGYSKGVKDNLSKTYFFYKYMELSITLLLLFQLLRWDGLLTETVPWFLHPRCCFNALCKIMQISVTAPHSRSWHMIYVWSTNSKSLIEKGTENV